MSVFFSGHEVLEVALEIEKNGVSFYDSLTNSTKDSTTRGTYVDLAGEERKRILVFQRIRDSLGWYQPPEDYPGENTLCVKAPWQTLGFLPAVRLF